MNKHEKTGIKSRIYNFYSMIDRKYHDSAIYNYFKSYDLTEEKFRDSLFYRFFCIDKIDVYAKYFKNSFAKKCEESTIMSYIKRFYDSVFSCSIRAFAVIFLCFSIYSIALNSISLALGNTSTHINDNIFAGVVLFIVSLILLAVKSTIPGFVANSRILSAFCYDILFDKKAELVISEPKAVSAAILIITGTVMGLLTYFTTVAQIILIFAFVIFVLVAFKIPENAFSIVLLLLPFLSVASLSLLCLVTFIAFFFKFLRGKRNFRLSFFDTLTILFILIIFVGSKDVSGIPLISTNTLPMIALASSYFVLVNCTRNRKQMRRYVYTISFSAALCAFLRVLNILITDVHVIPEFAGSGISILQSVISPFGGKIEYANYILSCLPFIFASMIFAGTNRKKLFYFISVIVCIFSLIEIHSKGIMLALVFMIIIFISTTFKNPASSLIVIVLSVLLFTLFITNSSFLGNDRYFSFNGYKENIISTTFDMIRDNPFGGIGFGRENFINVAKSYSHFSQHRIDNCYDFYIQLFVQTGVFGIIFILLHLLMYCKMLFTKLSYLRKKSLVATLVMVAAFSSIAVMCFRGISSYIWQDHRSFLMYFLVMAIASAKCFDKSCYETYQEVTNVTEQ